MQDRNCPKCGTDTDFGYCLACELVILQEYTILSQVDHLLKEDSTVTILLGDEDIIARVSFDGKTVEGRSEYIEDALADLENTLWKIHREEDVGDRLSLDGGGG